MLDRGSSLRLLAAGVVMLGLLAPAGAEGPKDHWAPGASDHVWRAIERLQAFPDFVPAVPNWRAALADPEPLVRAAAIVALARSRARIADSAGVPLLDDPSPVVRDAALWALLRRGGPSARAAVLQAVSLPLVPHTDLLERLGVPPGVGRLSQRTRRDWLGLFARAWQIDGRPRRCAVPPVAGVSAARSEMDADGSVTVGTRLDDDACAAGTLDLGRMVLRWQEVDQQGRPFPRRGEAPSSRLRTEDGSTPSEIHLRAGELIRLTLSREPWPSPGVYVLNGAGMGPLFLRVRRGRAFEASIPELLERVEQAEAAGRLGDQRVQDAGPPLLARLRQLCPEDQARRGRPGPQQANDLSLALSRAATPAQQREAARLFLLCGVVPSEPAPWQAGAVLSNLGEPGREALQDFLADWREQRRLRATTLAAVVGWPGLTPGSRGDQARLELAAAAERGTWPLPDGKEAPLSGYDWQAVFRALGSLAENHPVEAGKTLSGLARLPATPWVTFTWLWPRGADAGPGQRQALRNAWAVTRGDTGASLAARSALAARLLELEEDAEGLETQALVPGSDTEAKAWLERLPGVESSRYARALEAGLVAYLDESPASAAPSGPSTAAVQATRAELRLALARQLLDRDPPSAAKQAAAARPLRQAADQGWAHLILGRAHLRAGRAQAAYQSLDEARTAFLAAVGSGAGSGQLPWLERTLPRLRLALANPGLALARESAGWTDVGDVPTPVRHGEVTFRALAGGRLVRRVGEGPDEFWAAVPFAVAHVLPLGPDRVVVGGAGRLALLAPEVVWQSPPGEQPAPEPWREAPALIGDVLLARGASTSAALDPRTGRILWRSITPWLRCSSCERRGFMVRSGLTDKDARTGRPLPEMRSYTAWASIQTERTAWEVAGRSVAAAAGKDTVLLVDERGGLRALKQATGQLLWAQPAVSSEPLDAFPAASASLEGDLLYVSRGLELAALEAATGTVRWRRAWWPAVPATAGYRADERRLVETRGGVLLAQLWSSAESAGSALDLMLFDASGAVALHESVPRPGATLETWSADVDTLHFADPGSGELETWDLVAVPRRARVAARTEPWPSAFAFARQDEAGAVGAEGPDYSVRVSGGRLAIRPRGATAPLDLALEAPAWNWRCRLEPDRQAFPGPWSGRLASAAQVSCEADGAGARLLVVDAGDRIELALELPAGKRAELALGLAGVGQPSVADDGAALAEGPAGRLRLFPPTAYQWLAVGHDRVPARVQARFAPGDAGRLRLELGDHDVRTPLRVRLGATLAPPAEVRSVSGSEPGPAVQGPPAAAPEALLEALRDGNDEVRRRARQALDRMGAAAVPVLLGELGAPSEQVRYQAVYGLSRMVGESRVDPKLVIGPLIGLVEKSESTPVRISAMQALGHCGPAAKLAEPLLVRLVDGRDPAEEQRSLREAAAYALASLATSKEPAPALERALRDRNRGAADALWKTDPERAERLLTQAVKEGDAWACNTLVEALPAVPDQGMPKALLSALVLDGCRLSAVDRLSRGRDPATGGLLSKALEDPAANVRQKAAEGLRDLAQSEDPIQAREGRRALPALIAALSDPDAGVRATVVETLAGIGPVPRAAVDPLTRLLTDPDAKVRSNAAAAIGAVGLAGRPAGPALVRASTDTDPHVQAAAAKALREVKWGVSAGQLAQEGALAGAAMLQLVEDAPRLAKCACAGVRQPGGVLDDPGRDVMRRLRERCPGARTYAECEKRSPAKMPCASHLLVGPVTWRSEDEAEIEVSLGGPFERDFGTLVLSRVDGKWVVGERRLEHFSSE